jgi:sulfite reductase alpha subunit-like flavoprotein
LFLYYVGDSNYTTYLDNPTTITMALKAVGANELIKMGEADASQIGETSQRNTIIKWKEELWIPLAKAVAAATAKGNDNDESSDAGVDVKTMQKGSIPILMQIDPDYTPPKEFGGRSSAAIPMHLLAVAVIVALIAALFLTGVIEAP